jgi:outer membrane protein assembly factor BamD (BamD/ComL family)
MKYAKTFMIVLLLPFAVQAKQAKASIDKQPITSVTWQQLDSLGNAALIEGDTSTAITCYEGVINLHPVSWTGNKMLEQLRKRYRHAASSFYLKEY